MELPITVPFFLGINAVTFWYALREKRVRRGFGRCGKIVTGILVGRLLREVVIWREIVAEIHSESARSRVSLTGRAYATLRFAGQP